MIPDDSEQAALADMRRMDQDGASFRAIAAMLEARGVRLHRGAAWYASTVRAMLRSRMATAA